MPLILDHYSYTPACYAQTLQRRDGGRTHALGSIVQKPPLTANRPRNQIRHYMLQAICSSSGIWFSLSVLRTYGVLTEYLRRSYKFFLYVASSPARTTSKLGELVPVSSLSLRHHFDGYCSTFSSGLGFSRLPPPARPAPAPQPRG